MMKQLFIKLGVTTLFSLLCSTYLHAQVVTDERMFSFEEPQIPDCISAVQSQLSISDIHYKDGKHSLEWTFEPGAVLQIKKDLKFEKKDPTGKDLYLSAFIVWVYNETSQDATIEFEFLKLKEMYLLSFWYQFYRLACRVGLLRARYARRT